MIQSKIIFSIPCTSCEFLLKSIFNNIFLRTCLAHLDVSCVAKKKVKVLQYLKRKGSHRSTVFCDEK